MDQVLTKTLGPIGRPRYRWISLMNNNEPLYNEMLASAKSLGFRVINTFDYGTNKEFTIEPRNEDQDAIFILTWSEHINGAQYEHDKGRKYPADWITKILYYTVQGADRNLPMAMIIPVCMIVIPMWVSKFWNITWVSFISFVGLFMMLTLVFLRVYDDARVSNHEQKLREQDDKDWESQFISGGLHEKF
jgi:hypothetical protein